MTHAARSKMIVLRLLNSVRYRSDRHPLVNPGVSHAGCGGDFPASERRRVQAGEEGLELGGYWASVSEIGDPFAVGRDGGQLQAAVGQLSKVLELELNVCGLGGFPWGLDLFIRDGWLGRLVRLGGASGAQEHGQKTQADGEFGQGLSPSAGLSDCSMR